MASIVGGIGTSHIPAIGNAISRGWQNEPYWKPFFDGYKAVHGWLDSVQPDVAVVIYNDHGLNFFLDKMPTFAVGAASQYRNADEGWGLPVVPPFPGCPELSWHIIKSLIADEFDITTCQEMLVDHAFAVPMALLWPQKDSRPVLTIPISVNTVQFPLPSPTRCYKLGQSIGRAIESLEGDLRVLVVATGGLSHQLDGTRAGFINTEFDRMWMDKIVTDPATLTQYSAHDLVRLSGAQGVELLMWMVMRGALTGTVSEKHHNYHVPISNTAAGVIVLENKRPEFHIAGEACCTAGMERSLCLLKSSPPR
jgi:protocatechuate 4,5-dioxygenase beta chain